MRQFIAAIIFLFASGMFSVAAQDFIILKDGNMIEAKVTEISPSEIRYKRFDNLDGPTIVIPSVNVLSIRYENGTTEVISAFPEAGEKTKPAVRNPEQFYFGISADPSGFLLYGPSIFTEFTKNHFNTQIYISFPSLGLAVEAESFAFGGGMSMNYLRHTRLGAIYFGGLFNFGVDRGKPRESYGYGVYVHNGSTYSPSKYLWVNDYSFALNLGYKFLLSSGMYFNAGGNLGLSIIADHRKLGYTTEYENKFFIKPVISIGYNFYGSKPGSEPPAQSIGSSEYITLSGTGWKAESHGANSTLRNNTDADYFIDREYIDGQEREVLLLEVSLARGEGWRLGQFMLLDETIIQKLRDGSGVRFKVLGDGETWALHLPTVQVAADNGNYEKTFATKRGKITTIDIPYSKLKQPSWAKKVAFDEESITCMIFQRHSDNGTRDSTIKIFDLEIY